MTLLARIQPPKPVLITWPGHIFALLVSLQ
jgi:hypothetical protein